MSSNQQSDANDGDEPPDDPVQGESPIEKEKRVSLVEEYFPGHLETQTSGATSLSPRADRFSGLSVAQNQAELDQLPLMLLVFVCLVAAFLGFVVAGFHSMIREVGCPLGVNGCNNFSGLGAASKSSVLIKALDGYVPEDVVFVMMGIMSLLIIGLILDFVPETYSKQALGGGTVQALLAVAAGIPISLRCALLRVLVSAIYFAGGGTMGGDGPTIQVCTALAGMIGWMCGIRSPRTQSLLASLGFSCGFAASFNAPLAGILFAMEELQHVSSRLTTRVIIIILIGSVVSTSVMRGFLGNQVLYEISFHPDLSDLVSGASINKVFGENCWMLIAIPIGLMSAIVGYILSKVFHIFHWFLRTFAFPYCPRCIVFAIIAGISAAIGSAVFRLTGMRGVWGIGVQSLSYALTQNAEVEDNDALIMAMGKLLAFALGVAARFPGDTLVPVLISGGFLGSWVGRWLPIFGQEGRSACEIFGMVGLFTSCFRFPLTPILMVLELTGTESYLLILPVALSSFTALFVSNHFFPPLIEQLLAQDGIDLEAIAELAEAADDEENDFQAELSSLEGRSTPDSSKEGKMMHQSHNSILSADSMRSLTGPSALQAALGKLESSMAEIATVDHRSRRLSRVSMASSRRSQDSSNRPRGRHGPGSYTSEASQNSSSTLRDGRDGVTRRISFKDSEQKHPRVSRSSQRSRGSGSILGRPRVSRVSRGSGCSSMSPRLHSSRGSSGDIIAVRFGDEVVLGEDSKRPNSHPITSL